MKTIELSRGMAAIVDDEDFDTLAQWNWHYDNNGYAVRNVRISDGKRTLYKMHREILGLKHGDRREADHINHVRTDNRRCNLRIVEKRQNAMNRQLNKNSMCKLKGVYWHKRIGKFQAGIAVDGKSFHLGYFSTPKEASEAYNQAAIKLHREFACLN